MRLTVQRVRSDRGRHHAGALGQASQTGRVVGIDHDDRHIDVEPVAQRGELGRVASRDGPPPPACSAR
jgi:hypothetical protein